MPDTLCANHPQRGPACKVAYAMLFSGVGSEAVYSTELCQGRPAELMILTDRTGFARRAIALLFVLAGIPNVGRPAALEDSAKEFARNIAAALPTGENVAVEVRNTSPLQPDEVARIESALETNLQQNGVRVSKAGDATTKLVVSLSANLKEFVWTCEIRQGDASRAVLFAAPREWDNHSASNSMQITVRGEKFWEGKARILDAVETSNGSGKSWLVLLLPSSLSVEDLQAGSVGRIDFVPALPPSRDPWGQLGADQKESTIWFAVNSQKCKVNLETQSSPECLSKEEMEHPDASRSPMSIDLAPAGPPPPGKALELVITPVCGGTNQFLATSARDDTQTDSLQVFHTEPNGPVAMSGEADFPGPIVALHSSADAPRAIVRNLSTGNYEAYRLAISCGQ